CDTLIQHMESVKKSIDERALHKREYDIRLNERQIQTTEDKVDSSKALDASLVDTESSGTTIKEQDTSSRSGNDAHADYADIRPIYDEEPMAEVQTTAEINIFVIGQQHIEQPVTPSIQLGQRKGPMVLRRSTITQIIENDSKRG
ncbi:hypothetical protein Tco_0433979, partial [Tanacetum coccineum]